MPSSGGGFYASEYNTPTEGKRGRVRNATGIVYKEYLSIGT